MTSAGFAAKVPAEEIEEFHAALEAWKLSCVDGESLIYWRRVLGLSPNGVNTDLNTDNDCLLSLSTSHVKSVDNDDEQIARKYQKDFDVEFAESLNRQLKDDISTLEDRGGSQDMVHSLTQKRKYLAQAPNTTTKKATVSRPKYAQKWRAKPNPLEAEESDTYEWIDSSDEEDQSPSTKRIRANAAYKDLQEHLSLGQPQNWFSRDISDLTKQTKVSLVSSHEDSDLEMSSQASLESTDSDDGSESISSPKSDPHYISGSTEIVSIDSSRSSPPETDESPEKLHLDGKPSPDFPMDGKHQTYNDVAIMVGSKIFHVIASRLKEHSEILADLVEQRNGRQVIENRLLADVSPSDFSALEQFLASGEFSPLLTRDPYESSTDFAVPATSFKPVNLSRFRLLDVDLENTGEHETALLGLGDLLLLGIRLATPRFVESVLEKLQYGFPSGYHILCFLVFARQVFDGISGISGMNGINIQPVNIVKEWIATVLESKQTDLATDGSSIGEVYWELVDGNPDLEKRLRGGRAILQLSA